MNTNQLKFYSIYSQISWFAKSYRLKILFLVFVGLQIPLLVLLFSQLSSITEPLTLLAIIITTTVISTAITLYLLLQLLNPLILTSQALRGYIQNQKKPNLPVDYEDALGRLMADMQYLVETLETYKSTLSHQANIDPLTGLPNHLAGEELLLQDMARAQREDTQMLIVIIDIDQFNQINEQFGPQLGDICLTQVVEAMTQCIRKGDWLARWGGDQFLMVLWNFNHLNPIEVLKRVQQQSIQTPMGELLQISLSIGACSYKGNADLDTQTELETLLINLEEALSQAKSNQPGGISCLE